MSVRQFRFRKTQKYAKQIGWDCAALGVDSKGNSLKQPMHPFHLAYGIGLKGSVARVRNKNPQTYIHTCMYMYTCTYMYIQICSLLDSTKTIS